MIDDGTSRVTEMVNEQVAPARILSKFTHSYDAIGNRTSRREVVGGFSGSGATDGVETLYEYDDLDRLTRSTQPEERFEYDLVGNRTEHGQSYNGLNQLTSDGKYAYTFDLNGNRTSKRDIVTNEVTEYQWDSDDQMTRVTMKNGAGVTTKILRLYYDGLGRRKEKQYQDNEVMARSYTRKYILEGDTVLQERDAVGNVVATYLHGPGIDDPITMLRDVDGNGSINHDNEVWHLTKDTLGSIKDLTNPTGQVVQRYRHAPYGLQTLELDESRLDSKEIENPFGFTGHWLDKETGLICADFRCLDPNTGTWITRDRIWPNDYLYVEGNPINLRDPDGLLGIPGTWFWVDAGEAYGEYAAQYWANQAYEAERSGNTLAQYGYNALGLLSSLWTCETSSDTALTLATAGIESAVSRLGFSFWARGYKNTGGGGIGLNRNGKNLIRFDVHPIKQGGPYRPHVDIPGVVKHWPWQ